MKSFKEHLKESKKEPITEMKTYGFQAILGNRFEDFYVTAKTP